MIKPQRAIVISFVAFLCYIPAFGQDVSLHIEWTKVNDIGIDSLAVSPDGSQIAFSSREAQTMAVIDWRLGDTIWELHEALGSNVGVAAQIAWSPAGDYIARIASDGSLAIYSAADGTRLEPVEEILNNVRIVLTEISSGEPDFFTDLQWNADGTQLAVMVRSYIVVFDLRENRVQSVINPHIVPSSLHGQLSSFAWSPDSSRFAAYHFRIEDRQEVIRPHVVMGFWDRNGRWLREYEENSGAEGVDNCIENGDEIFRLRGSGNGFMGGRYEWSPNNSTIAVAEHVITVDYRAYSTCTLNADGTVSVSRIGDFAPEFIHWSSDGEYLFAVGIDCSVYLTVEGGRGTTDWVAFDEPCRALSTSWSQEDQFVVLGTADGIWIGEVIQ